jgi:hypothetical protein
MARMTRTQISLDERQYQFLKREASLTSMSLSAIVRALIDERLAAQATSAPRLADAFGFFSSGASEGLDHDHYLYGWPREGFDVVP